MQQIEQLILGLMRQAEQDASEYQRRRPGGVSNDSLYIDACEMADYRLPGDNDEAAALRACYVLVFRTAVRY